MGGCCSGLYSRADGADWNGITHSQFVIKPDNPDKAASKCTITGIAFLTTGEIILADHYNRKLKMFSRQFELLSKLKCTCAPFDLCASSKGAHSILTTLTGESTILTVWTDYDVLEPGRSIATRGPCYGITCFRDYLFVIVKHIDEGWVVQMMDLSGNVKRSFQDDLRGMPLFEAPRYIDVSQNGAYFFVSDVVRNHVVCINTQTGAARFTYQDTNLNKPMGVTKDHKGNVYVISCKPCCVHQVTEDGERVGIVLGKGNRLPRETQTGSICYDRRYGMFAVAAGDETQMKLFHIRPVSSTKHSTRLSFHRHF